MDLSQLSAVVTPAALGMAALTAARWGWGVLQRIRELEQGRAQDNRYFDGILTGLGLSSGRGNKVAITKDVLLKGVQAADAQLDSLSALIGEAEDAAVATGKGALNTAGKGLDVGDAAFDTVRAEIDDLRKRIVALGTSAIEALPTPI